MVFTNVAMGCKNKLKTDSKRTFHRTPTTVQRRTEWLDVLGIPLTIPVEKINWYVVCKEHFIAEDYNEKMQY